MPRNKFPRTQRLLSRADYRLFRQGSKKFVYSAFLLYVRPNGLSHPRLGITIRARGSSVERNRVKRAVREFFRTSGWAKAGQDYNFVIPSEKKLSHPYPLNLKKALRQELSP